jgi:TPR repeat protein
MSRPERSRVCAFLSCALVIASLVAPTRLMAASGSTPPALAEALSSYDRGDFASAVRVLKPLALRGNASAQYMMGVMNAAGQGVPRDDEEAVRWLVLAGEKGHASAQYELGVRFFEGEGVAQDEAAAAKWFALSAAQGHAGAQHNYGVMLAGGWGVPKDESAALGFFDRAARQGQADAQYNLGVIYANGQGVPVDLPAAYVWLSLAVSSFGEADTEGRDMAAAGRDDVAKLMAPEQMEAALAIAAKGLPAAPGAKTTANLTGQVR